MIQEIFFAFWFFGPVGLANLAAFFSAKIPYLKKLSYPIDFYLKFRGKRIFGSHKTIRGFVVGILISIAIVYIQIYFYDKSASLRQIIPINYYEIDPVVQKIAGDPKYFGYLTEAPAKPRVILGDGRLSIAAAKDHDYDMIFLDAFSSDSIPLHLVTREAVERYLLKLNAGGCLVFNISNRYFNLEQVLARLARSEGLTAFLFEDVTTPEDKKQNIYDSWWVVMGRKEDLGWVSEFPQWKELDPQGHEPVWTDDFSNLFSVLKFRNG